MDNRRWSRVVLVLAAVAALAVGCGIQDNLLNPSFSANLGINPNAPSQTETLTSVTTFAFVNNSGTPISFNLVYQLGEAATSLVSSGAFTAPANSLAPSYQLLQTALIPTGKSINAVISCPLLLNLGEATDPVVVDPNTGAVTGTGLSTGNAAYYIAAGNALTGIAVGSGFNNSLNLLQTRDFQCGQVIVYTALPSTPAGGPPAIAVSVRSDIPTNSAFLPAPQ